MPLVNYDSASSDSEDEPSHKAIPVSDPKSTSSESSVGVKRKRGLPKLPSNFDSTNPRDDPTQHQGRTRSRPFVAGDHNAHAYISVILPLALRRVIEDITSEARKLCPGYMIHSLTSTTSSTSPSAEVDLRPSKPSKEIPSASNIPLHISLTHPIPLRHPQLLTFRDELRSTLQRRSDKGPIRLSLAGEVVAFVNGRRSGGEGRGGRAFLAVQVSAGSNEIERIVDEAIHPILSRQHLPLYHKNPLFHASFAWTLIGKPISSEGDIMAEEVVIERGASLGEIMDTEISSSRVRTPFTSDIIATLSEKFGKALLESQAKGGWIVDQLQLKIGKEVHMLDL